MSHISILVQVVRGLCELNLLLGQQFAQDESVPGLM